MKKNLLSLLSLLIVLISSNMLISQSDISININGKNLLRDVVFPTQETSNLQICGLQIGKSYTIYTGNNSQNYSYLSTNELNTEQHNISFTANADCEIVYLHSDFVAGERAPFISVNCIDCVVRPAQESPLVENIDPRITITATPNANADYLVRDIFIGGGCFDITGASINGPLISIGTFNGGAPVFGPEFDNGIILSTGSIFSVGPPGTNIENSANTNTMGNSGDPDLLTLSNGISVNDNSILEFDFTPTLEQVTFKYAFASEEYCDYSGPTANYNDVFGFFVSGPGISGNQNIALLPSGEPVSIQNVNQNNNQIYFNGNAPTCGGITSSLIYFDGYTSVFEATANVIPCQTYHIKLAIGDGGDVNYDSAVFLAANSFSAGVQATSTSGNLITNSPDSYESDCNEAYITFSREGDDLLSPIPISFTVGGTATQNVDYIGLPANNQITIPAGLPFITIPITILQDDIEEGLETIEIYLEEACSCTADLQVLNIYDAPEITVELPDQEVCAGLPTALVPQTSGGFFPYTYDWGDGPTQNPLNIITPEQTTTYTVTVTDACGGEKIVSNTVTVSDPQGVLGGSASLCSENSTASLDVNFTGSDGPFSIIYSIDGATQPAIENITDIPYQLEINQQGTYVLENILTEQCLGTASGTVEVGAGSNATVASQITNSDCAGSASGAIDLTVTDASGTVTYLWSDNVTTEDRTNLAAGNYTVTINDGGCEQETSFTIAENPALVVSLQNTINVDCSNPNAGTIDITATGGDGNLTYAWSNSSSNEDLSGVPVGTYSVTVTDGNNCEQILDNLQVTGDTNTPTAEITSSGVLDCQSSNVTLSIANSTTGANISYEWTDGTSSLANGTNETSFMVNAEGTYNLIVTNTDNNCFSETSITVTEDSNTPTADAGANQTLDCNTNTIQLNGNASTTGTNIIYQWTGPNVANIVNANTPTPSIDVIGTYTLTVTNTDNNCSSTATVVVDENIIEPSVSIDTPASFDCDTDNVQLNATNNSTENFSYQWTGVGNITNATTLTPTVDAPGNYTLTTTNNDNGCSNSTDVTIPQNSSVPSISIMPPAVINCDGNPVTIDASGSDNGANYTYQWSVINGTGNIQDDNTLTPTVDAAGTYTLLVTDMANNCTNTAQVIVQEDSASPTAALTLDNNIDCTNTTANIDGTTSSTGTNFTYEWDLNGTVIPNENTPTLSNISQVGIYTLTVVNQNNNCSDDASVTINEDITSPVFTASASNVIDCANTNATLNVNITNSLSNLSYSWSADANGSISSPTDQQQITVTNAATYYVTVTNEDNGCSTENMIQVTENVTAPSISFSQPNEINCTNTSQNIMATVTANGNVTYNWTGAGIENGQGTDEITVNQGGTYTLNIVDDANGCPNSNTISVVDNRVYPTANADVATSDVIDCNNQTLDLDATASSGIGTLTYSWTAANGGTITQNADTPNPTITAAGTYTVLVTDQSNNCTETDDVIITENINIPVANAGIDIQLDCNTNNVNLDGSDSDTGNHSYLWTATNGGAIQAGEETSITPTITVAGTYTLEVTDNTNGCTHTDDVIVTEDANAPVLSVSADNNITCTNTIVNLTGTINNASNYDYNWTTTNGGNIVSSDNTLTPSVDAAGTYTLNVVNLDNNCPSAFPINVQAFTNVPTVMLNASNIINCANTDATISTAGTDVTNHTLIWTTNNGVIIPDNTENPVVTQAGNYTLVVTDNTNGCQEPMSVNINEDIQQPVVSIVPPNQLDCQNTAVTLSGAGSSTGNEYTYTWTDVNTGTVIGNTIEVTVSQAGNYELLVENTNNGCSQPATTTVTQNIMLPTAMIAMPDVLDCNTLSTILDGAGSDTGSDYDYLWEVIQGSGTLSTPTSLNTSVDMPGIYQLSVTNTANNCTQNTTIEVFQNLTEPVLSIAQPDIITCTNDQVILNASGTDATNFSWSGNNIQNPNTATPIVSEAGNYTVTAVHTTTGCTGTASINVDEDRDLPSIDIEANFLLDCNTESTTLTATTDATNPTFVWTNENGDTYSIQSPTIEATGIYTLVVTNEDNQCQEEATTLVYSDAPNAFEIEKKDANCTSGYGTISIDNVQGGIPNYIYSINNGETFSSNTNFAQLEAGVYNVIVQDSNGCEHDEVVTINAPEELELYMDDVVELKLGDTYDFPTQTNRGISLISTIKWTPEINLSCIDCLNPSVTPTESIRYELFTVDTLGCKAENSTLLLVDERPDIFIPSAFSPNGDGENEVFTIYADADVVSLVLEFEIFSRWGEIIHAYYNFPPNNESYGWDGTHKTDAMNENVFIYRIKVLLTDGTTKELTGDVTLTQ